MTTIASVGGRQTLTAAATPSSRSTFGWSRERSVGRRFPPEARPANTKPSRIRPEASHSWQGRTRRGRASHGEITAAMHGREAGDQRGLNSALIVRGHRSTSARSIQPTP